MAKTAYDLREQKIWEHNLDSAPHGQPWHTSFHASRFPADPEKACGRQALYGLMDLPPAEPGNQYLRAIGDAGKAIEDEYTARWEEADMLLSRPPTSKYQTGYADPRFWLSGNLDAVLRPAGWNRGHVVDIKSKDHDVIDQMRRGARSYEPAHYYQVQVYLGFLQQFYMDLYEDYADRLSVRDDTAYFPPKMFGLTDPPDSGSILYVSRNRPRHTYEFSFAYDPEVWNRGTARLHDYKMEFINDVLPPRPKDWRWLEQPCQYCNFKKLCKADEKAGVTTISGSGVIPAAKKLKPSYDYDTARAAVLNRWRGKDADIPNA